MLVEGTPRHMMDIQTSLVAATSDWALHTRHHMLLPSVLVLEADMDALVALLALKGGRL